MPFTVEHGIVYTLFGSSLARTDWEPAFHVNAIGSGSYAGAVFQGRRTHNSEEFGLEVGLLRRRLGVASESVIASQ